ncbi:putative ATP-binding protein involved in virulence [Winogradskyella pacifica]|uniref:Putative ATP-binding protein involved in virulence n=1 Tax=Winogradskyella pacifica TaxID=664642 RepID=A0A3D9MZN9_9FLAO|nr:ATP-binding protein [Winogradskyella pacifica]REE24736.1 putative ATP-binding protein involved in virulence [Winogradskyella pacifica]
MRIRKIELQNHFILKNLNIDFTDEENNSVDTLIFAGENGTGKTAILDLLFEFSLFQLNNTKRDEVRVFEIELNQNELTLIRENNNHKNSFVDGFENGIFRIKYDFNITGNWNHLTVSYNNANKQPKTIIGTFLVEPDIKSNLKVIYSDVEINYTSKAIKSVTAKDLDQTQNSSYKSNSNLATDITQLLIDIQSLDSQEFAQWAKQNIGSTIDESKIDIRIKRFTKAFEAIFPSKKFLGVENRNNLKEVLFKEDDKIMSINQLSSGEKQIVFRGGFLLKDKVANIGSIVLIDEPEISLHPKWQIEILDFYKTLINSDTDNNSQIFISTHSPFIIHNPNRRNDKVIILTKLENGEITTLEKPEFYSWTNNKLVKEAFGIDYNLDAKQDRVFVEGETDEKYFNKAIEIFELADKLDFVVTWIGRINEKGNAEFTGDTALNQAKSFFSSNLDLIQSKILLYYDSDTNKPEETIGDLLIKKMPKNDENTLFNIGIENLLVLPEGFNLADFCSERTKTDEYGVESIIRKLDKTKLCDWICDENSIENQKNIFLKLFGLLNNLKEVLEK